MMAAPSRNSVGIMMQPGCTRRVTGYAFTISATMTSHSTRLPCARWIVCTCCILPWPCRFFVPSDSALQRYCPWSVSATLLETRWNTGLYVGLSKPSVPARLASANKRMPVEARASTVARNGEA